MLLLQLMLISGVKLYFHYIFRKPYFKWDLYYNQRLQCTITRYFTEQSLQSLLVFNCLLHFCSYWQYWRRGTLSFFRDSGFCYFQIMCRPFPCTLLLCAGHVCTLWNCLLSYCHHNMTHQYRSRNAVLYSPLLFEMCGFLPRSRKKNLSSSKHKIFV